MSRRISFRRFLLVALYTHSVLSKFHFFENSLGGVPGSSNFCTRLNLIVCRQKWPFFYDTFLKIFPTNFLLYFLASCPICVLWPYKISCLWKLPSWGIQELELGYPTANKEHEPFVFYETFLKKFPTNYFLKIPASCFVYVLCPYQVSCLWNLPSWDTQELELGYPTANEEHEPFVVYETFLKNFPTNLL